MKQTKLWLATIATLLCSLTANAHDFEVGGIYYNITSEEELTVAVTYRGSSYDYYSNEYSGAVTIPETVTYNNNTYSVTSIGYAAFRGCSSLVSVIIPNGVTSIGGSAFSGCSDLASISISEGVTEIGSSAFHNCESLTSITIPESVTEIGSYAFLGCESLITIDIPEGMTSIGESAFRNCYGLASIVIPKGVTRIGSSAFENCYSLTSIIIPESVTTIGAWAFENCYRLTSITIPVDVTVINNYTFCGCSSLTAITIPEGVTEIGIDAFRGCSSLVSVIIPNGVTSIGGSAFSGCSDLASISISEGVTEIGSSAFHNCESLTSITIPESVVSIGGGAFSGCMFDDNNFINNSNCVDISYWGAALFDNDYNGVLIRNGVVLDSRPGITTAVIPEGVTEIGEGTFYYCSNLTAITIPKSVISIGNSAFTGCTSLKEVIIEDGSTTLSLGYGYYSRYGDGQGLFNDCPVEKVYLGRNLSYNNDSHYGRSPFYNKDELTNVVVGNDVTEIGQYAFENCDNLHSLTIGSAVLSIGSYAFSYPDKIIWLTNTPPTDYNKVYGRINYVANDQYTNLSNTKVYPYLSSMFEVDGVKYVPVSPAERTCHAIDCAYDSTATIINVGEAASFKGVAMKVTEVMPYAFYENNHIKEVNIAHKGNIGDYAFYNCDSILSVELSNEGNIGIKAFYDNDGIQEIIVPNSVMSLGQYCFYDCDSLKSVVLGDGVSAISDYAFSACSSLNDVEIGSSVATINNYAFQNCSSLPTITIPQAVTTIGDNVFAGCSNLSDVIITDRTEPLALGSNDSSPLFADCPLDSVYIGGKITYNTTSSKGYSPFYRNTSLRTVVITDREEQIYDNEFYGCTNLKNVAIGNGVKSIGDYAFSGCSSLAGFSFGSNMESIGTEAFSDCTNLTSITSHAAVPPTCGTQALDDINKWSCTLRVPSGYAAAYQAADQWKEFFFVEDVVEVEKYVLTYVVDGEVYHTDTLVHKATIVLPEAPTKEGYTFSGWSEAPETMPANDVTISGTFIINKYLVTFKIGDEVIAADSLEYGATIVAPEAPEKEGHTFNGWGEVANSVPANDLTYEGSYSVNSYLLTYTVDGDTIQSDSIAYGTEIALPEEPAKEGHIFSGWSEAPETMPANDVTISGTFTVNKYLVTFKIGDEVIVADSLEYGAAIVAPEAPEKEGHTFNGWGEVANSVPANDVTYEGSYSVNSYLLTYTVDGDTIQSDSIAYGTEIALPEEPAKEGHTFSGWSEAPETMPAEDVTISGTFTVNTYKVYYYVGEELVHTAEVVYGEAIPEYIYEPTGEGDIFDGWVGETYETMPAYDVTYVANITNDVLQLTVDNSQLTIYDLGGRKIEVGDLRELEKGVYIVNGRKVVVND